MASDTTQGRLRECLSSIGEKAGGNSSIVTLIDPKDDISIAQSVLTFLLGMLGQSGAYSNSEKLAACGQLLDWVRSLSITPSSSDVHQNLVYEEQINKLKDMVDAQASLIEELQEKLKATEQCLIEKTKRVDEMYNTLHHNVNIIDRMREMTEEVIR